MDGHFKRFHLHFLNCFSEKLYYFLHQNQRYVLLYNTLISTERYDYFYFSKFDEQNWILVLFIDLSNLYLFLVLGK